MVSIELGLDDDRPKTYVASDEKDFELRVVVGTIVVNWKYIVDSTSKSAPRTEVSQAGEFSPGDLGLCEGDWTWECV